MQVSNFTSDVTCSQRRCRGQGAQLMFPISTRAPCFAASPSYFKCFTCKMEPLNSATASIPFNSCVVGELQAPRELLGLVLGSSEKSKQTEKHLIKSIQTHRLLGREHRDQTWSNFSLLVPLIQGCCKGQGSGTAGHGVALPHWGTCRKGERSCAGAAPRDRASQGYC